MTARGGCSVVVGCVYAAGRSVCLRCGAGRGTTIQGEWDTLLADRDRLAARVEELEKALRSCADPASSWNIGNDKQAARIAHFVDGYFALGEGASE